FVNVPYALSIHPSIPAANIREFISYAKARPGKLHFSSSGSGGTPHLCGELLKTMAGIDMVHVPYKGGAPAMIDLLSGQVQMYCAGITASLPHAKSGRLRLIAATTLKRSAVAPDVPTAHESGLAGFDVASWISIMAPAKTPRPIIQRLYDEIARITNEPTMRNYIIAQGAEPALQTPDEFSAYLKEEIAKWAKVVKASGARID
ncbi:MAG TPA: tripartite tricarboxylate transporter substrate-binding protein, partial [Burkholderiales bacterium]